MESSQVTDKALRAAEQIWLPTELNDAKISYTFSFGLF